MIKDRVAWLNTFIEFSSVTKTEIAKAIGVSPISVRDILLYQKKAINEEKFRKMCNFLGLNYEYFYDAKCAHPFKPKTVYKLKIKEYTDLIDLFPKKLLNLSLSCLAIMLPVSSIVCFLLFKHKTSIFLVAKRSSMLQKIKPFDTFHRMYEKIKSFLKEISVDYVAGTEISIEELEEWGGKKRFLEIFFEKATYENYKEFFERTMVATLTLDELDMLYFLRAKGIKNIEELKKRL